MDSNSTDSTQSSSKTRVVLIVLGVIVALGILISSAYAVFMAAQPKKTAQNQQSTQQTAATVTSADFKAGLDKLTSIADQEKANRAKAQTVHDDQQKRIKLSN
jgi:Na+-transporting NADH:ubiquinone oxidoreductase subunit NqrC